jgi:predicted  nucleic acid-binding Zn-ribbon protein
MKRTKDIIEAKQKELEVLQAESNSALDVVISTINQLLAVNEKIEANMSEIAEAKTKLAVTEEGLNTTKEHNSKIISKFRALIED